MTRSGDLIAHSNISLVLQRRNLAALNQVKAAFQSSPDAPRPRAIVAYNIEGKQVFSSYALVPNLDWAVFIERPTNEAYAPIYASLFSHLYPIPDWSRRFSAGKFLRGTTVVRTSPDASPRVKQIREGDLTTRFDVKTGDEIEILADEFNDMAAHLAMPTRALNAKWLSEPGINHCQRKTR